MPSNHWIGDRPAMLLLGLLVLFYLLFSVGRSTQTETSPGASFDLGCHLEPPLEGHKALQ